MPTIGVGTLESLRASGGRVLAVEAGRTILVDAPAMAATATAGGITLVGFCDAAGLPETGLAGTGLPETVGSGAAA